MPAIAMEGDIGDTEFDMAPLESSHAYKRIPREVPMANDRQLPWSMWLLSYCSRGAIARGVRVRAPFTGNKVCASK